MTKPRILIIDDDLDICEEVAAALERHGFETRWTTLPTGTFLTDGFVPDVVVLDLSMPHIDGFEVIAMLGEVHAKPQLIVASGHDERIIDAAMRSAGALGLTVLGGLAKPYSIKSLVAAAEAYQPPAETLPDDDLRLIERIIADDSFDHHMRVAFQSKRRLSDAAIIGYEALTRIVVGRPVNPEVAYSDAVPLAARLRMTGIVLDEAIRFAAVLARQGCHVPVAINCSPTILCAPPLVETILALLKHYDVPASSLLIELTEHNALISVEEVAAAAGRLALRGIRIVVDDFGRGTTSFEKLLQLPLSEMKIDKDIFWMAMAGKIRIGMLQEVVGYCREHGIVSTIEGIETAAHRVVAEEIGADYGQGYFWDRPQFSEDIFAGVDDGIAKVSEALLARLSACAGTVKTDLASTAGRAMPGLVC